MLSMQVWVCVLSRFSRVRHFVTPRTEYRQAPLSMGFSRQEYWSGLPFPSPGDLSDPEIKPESLMTSELAGRFFITSTTWEACDAQHSIQNHQTGEGPSELWSVYNAASLGHKGEELLTHATGSLVSCLSKNPATKDHVHKRCHYKEFQGRQSYSMGWTSEWWSSLGGPGSDQPDA